MRQDSTRKGSPSGVPAKRKRGAGYPARPGHFFHKYTRWLASHCFANTVGADGCWLLTTVASTEDIRRYSRAPNFFASQLALPCGFSISKLARVRGKCVEEGLLHYEPGGKGIPGIYWVLVPDQSGDLICGPLGEEEHDFLVQSDRESAGEPERKRAPSDAEPAANRCASVKPPSLPLPEPSPSKAREGGGSAHEGLSQAEAWAEIVTELDSLGMIDTLGTVEAARGKGLTPKEVLTVVAEYRERIAEFRGPGAIPWRLTRGRWPESDRPNLDAKRHEHLATETQRRNAEDDQHKAAVKEERSEIDRLVEKLGPEIDALSPEELERFVPAGPPTAILKSSGWRSAMTRGSVVRGFVKSRSNLGEAT